MLKFILSLFYFDYADVNYAWSSSRLNRFKTPHLFVPANRIGLKKRFALFFYKFIRSARYLPNDFIFLFSFRKKTTFLKYYGSQNQKKSIEKLNVKYRTVSVSECLDSDTHFPLFFAYSLALLLFPITFIFLFAKKETRRALSYNADNYLLSIGSYIVWVVVLLKLNPSFVIMSNDHNVMNRSLLYACELLKIKTIYVQHAPAVKGFPKLRFNYALLEGKHASDTYESYDFCEIYYIGQSVKLRENLRQRKKTQLAVGVSTGISISINCYQTLINLMKDSELEVVIRPHPADPNKNFWREFALNSGISFSDSQEENTLDFLNRLDALVSPMSGIFLESATFNIQNICFNAGFKIPDWYNLTENNVCIEVDTVSEVINLILASDESNQIKEQIDAIKYYYFSDCFDFSERVKLAIDNIVDINRM
ncbi:hypothetical protein CWC21_22220 [Pseudoalteromonas phenolica]|nr:hypothetical protein CWC21_22220 [Pseudoalteromonas phenolica]